MAYCTVVFSQYRRILLPYYSNLVCKDMNNFRTLQIFLEEFAKRRDNSLVNTTIPEPVMAQGLLGKWARGQGLQVSVLLARQEIGTGLGDAGQLAVTEDLGIGVVDLQRLQQVPHGGFLLLGAGVGSMAVGQQATLVADADGVLVVVPCMGSRQVLVPRLVHLAVAGDVIVVAGEPEP